MEREWYYVEMGNQRGPVTTAMLVDNVRRGYLEPTTLVWREGMDQWLQVLVVPELRDALHAPPPAPANNPGYAVSDYGRAFEESVSEEVRARAEAVAEHIQMGWRFVSFEYAISPILVSFRRETDIKFLSPSARILSALGFSVISLLAGPWGLPWGPIYTIMALCRNLIGGHDHTQDVVQSDPALRKALERGSLTPKPIKVTG